MVFKANTVVRYLIRRVGRGDWKLEMGEERPSGPLAGDERHWSEG